MTISTFDHVLRGDLDGLRVISPSQIFSFCSPNPKHHICSTDYRRKMFNSVNLGNFCSQTRKDRTSEFGDRTGCASNIYLPSCTYYVPEFSAVSSFLPQGPSRQIDKSHTPIPQIYLKCNQCEMFPMVWTRPANGTTEPTMHLATQEKTWCTETVFRHPP